MLWFMGFLFVLAFFMEGQRRSRQHKGLDMSRSHPEIFYRGSVWSGCRWLPDLDWSIWSDRLERYTRAKPILWNFLFIGANVCGLSKFHWCIWVGNFVGNWFVALQCKIIHFFVKCSWGRKREPTKSMNIDHKQTMMIPQ